MPKLLALFAVVAGIVLLILERSHVLGQPGGGGSCFWIAISAALIILGVVQLLDRHAPPPQ